MIISKRYYRIISRKIYYMIEKILKNYVEEIFLDYVEIKGVKSGGNQVIKRYCYVFLNV